MEEKTLFNIALICALLGVLIILFVSESKNISDSNIADISSKDLDKEVKIKGYVILSRNLPGILILNIKDNTGNITVVAFKEDKDISINTSQVVEIIGTVKEYEGSLEIEASTINII